MLAVPHGRTVHERGGHTCWQYQSTGLPLCAVKCCCQVSALGLNY